MDNFTKIMDNWNKKCDEHDSKKNKVSYDYFSGRRIDPVKNPDNSLMNDWKNYIDKMSRYDEENQNLKQLNKLYKEEGFSDLVKGDKALKPGISYQTLPQQPFAVGDDESPSPTTPVRVSKLSDSPELKKLENLRLRLDYIERKTHEARIKGDKKSLKKMLALCKKMRNKTYELSQLAQSQVDKDVT